MRSCVDAALLLMCWCCWCCWCTDAADALLLMLRIAADALIRRFCWCCWCTDSSTTTLSSSYMIYLFSASRFPFQAESLFVGTKKLRILSKKRRLLLLRFGQRGFSTGKWKWIFHWKVKVSWGKWKFHGEIESEKKGDCCCCSGLDREDNSTSFPIFCRCGNFPYFQITYKKIRLSLKKSSQIEFVKLFQNRAENLAIDLVEQYV